MKKITAILLLLWMLASCSKDEPATPAPLPLPVDTMSDARTILLKQVDEQRLPSPYFHFTYDQSKFVTEIAFASALGVYKVEYENKRVKKLTNTKNGRVLKYSYDKGCVSVIDEFSLTGEKRFTYQLFYNDAGKLVKLDWIEFSDAANGVLFKRSNMSYHPDGNLATMEVWLNNAGNLELSLKQEFSAYDNTTNVDDFYLLEEFFDSFLYLPQVKMQLNNPGKHIIKSSITTYDITYTYNFNSQQLPVKKSGVMIQTKGPEQGKTINIGSTYSYY